MYPYPGNTSNDEPTMTDLRGVLPGQRPPVDPSVLEEPTSEVPVLRRTDEKDEIQPAVGTEPEEDQAVVAGADEVDQVDAPTTAITPAANPPVVAAFGAAPATELTELTEVPEVPEVPEVAEMPEAAGPTEAGLTETAEPAGAAEAGLTEAAGLTETAEAGLTEAAGLTGTAGTAGLAEPAEAGLAEAEVAEAAALTLTTEPARPDWPGEMAKMAWRPSSAAPAGAVINEDVVDELAEPATPTEDLPADVTDVTDETAATWIEDKTIEDTEEEGEEEPDEESADLAVWGAAAPDTEVEPAAVAEAEPVTFDAEPVAFDAEPVAYEPARFEPANLEPADLLPADFESADLEPADLEPAGLQPADLEPAGLSPTGVSPADFAPAAGIGWSAPVVVDNERTPADEPIPAPETPVIPEVVVPETPVVPEVPVARRPGDVAETPIALWTEEAAERLRGQWRELQVRFIDDPDEAVAGAKSVVTEAVHELADTLLDAQDALDPCRGSGAPDTETMRVAMRRYREFLDRVLAL